MSVKKIKTNSRKIKTDLKKILMFVKKIRINSEKIKTPVEKITFYTKDISTSFKNEAAFIKIAVINVKNSLPAFKNEKACGRVRCICFIFEKMKRFLILLVISIKLYGQNSEIDKLIQNELKMNFPSIHFKHNSTDYSPMPYSVDSCFKYIALHFDGNMNSLVIWRDSTEAESLTKKRIKKLKTALNKYKETRHVYIESMGKEQKISRQTINMTSDSSKIKYLLTLNSVLDFSKTRPLNKATTDKHGLWLFGTCWKHAFHLNKNGREHCRIERRREQKSVKKK